MGSHHYKASTITSTQHQFHKGMFLKILGSHQYTASTLTSTQHRYQKQMSSNKSWAPSTKQHQHQRVRSISPKRGCFFRLAFKESNMLLHVASSTDRHIFHAVIVKVQREIICHLDYKSLHSIPIFSL